ncbi:hypothetical protein CC2G_003547 [Coprinopsis cinerea AmutBmut pab1-1]|nr:hypothetical protein CC2G_003547 [Coprinopsis cinerea AmutBmut pab1-1]
MRFSYLPLFTLFPTYLAYPSTPSLSTNEDSPISITNATCVGGTTPFSTSDATRSPSACATAPTKPRVAVLGWDERRHGY